ncbi:AbrB/MazE/SpoVT family DNA-binding domain-containing protein [Candidatus Bipolaricaulota bacterium]|nr:AbrB/MazE/SpoVT family DNA-binding domain-containing protein [Candidatus Bipolaricaulota bacterium]
MTTTATLTSKGQITIPKEIREKLELKKGDKLALIERDGNVILRKVSLEEIRQKALENYESGNTLSHEEVFENLK